MRIIIETPKYSFIKYRKEGTQFIPEFLSPVPTLFNYGFIEDTTDKDGMETDVIVIGPVMQQGDILYRESFDGIVKFIDDALRDDKHIIYIEGSFSKQFFSCYFRLYALFKTFLYLIRQGRISKCRFEGIEIYKEEKRQE